MHAVDAFRTLGRFTARTRELRELGVTTRGLASAVRRGDLVRVRVGHYALPGSAPHPFAAVRVGGIAACVSAGELFGLWLPPGAIPHVWLQRNASRLRDPPRDHSIVPGDQTHVCHWKALRGPIDRERGAVSLLDCLVQVVECEPRLSAIAILDSALASGVLDSRGLAELADALPVAQRGILTDLDTAAGSGTESIVRTVLRDAGFSVATQVEFRGVGFVDLLVGSKVVVEVDSTEWHGTDTQQARDYQRDLELVARGHIVVRVNYRQALYDHQGVLRAVRGALATARGE